MSISIGDIFAQCPDCGETGFRRKGDAEDGQSAKLIYVCVSCQAEISRIDLVNQIGDEATRRARSSLQRMRKATRRPKKPPG